MEQTCKVKECLVLTPELLCVCVRVCICACVSISKKGSKDFYEGINGLELKCVT